MGNNRTLLFAIIFLAFSACHEKSSSPGSPTIKSQLNEEKQKEIINTHLKNGAWKHDLYSLERQEEIDKGLAKDSTISYLWQQKSMPLFKQAKYELAMQYTDKAVLYDPEKWQDYRAFTKCIFAKTYKEAIKDFEDCIRKYGNRYVMDHSYNFYIALSKIQLNLFKEAEIILEEEVKAQLERHGEEWLQPLDLFYLGISKYEQKKYKDAIIEFDNVLRLYPKFSEAFYYKGKCQSRLGNEEMATELINQAKEYGKQGYSINEDNARHERYPYQVRWQNWD